MGEWHVPCKSENETKFTKARGIVASIRTRRRAQIAPPARVGSSETILVVEDESFVREVTCEILRQSGYRVFQAKNASAAKSLFSRRAEQIDLLICDAVLPDQSGAHLVQSLGQLSRNLRVVFVSGHPEARLRILEAGSTVRFLSKPYSADSLIAEIKRALRQELPTTRSPKLHAGER